MRQAWLALALVVAAAQAQAGDPAPADEGPACPSTLEGYVTEDGDIFMGWTPKTFGAPTVHRAEAGDDFVPLETLEFPTTKYIDATAEPGTAYRYMVTEGDQEPHPGCGVLEIAAVPDFPTFAAALAAVLVGLAAYAWARRR
jgi:hypothetical protein